MVWEVADDEKAQVAAAMVSAAAFAVVAAGTQFVAVGSAEVWPLPHGLVGRQEPAASTEAAESGLSGYQLAKRRPGSLGLSGYQPAKRRPGRHGLSG